MKVPATVSFIIDTPKEGINRATSLSPKDFFVTEVIAYVPVKSALDIFDGGGSIFGSKPIGGGIFATSRRSIRFGMPKKLQNQNLELLVECQEEPTYPIQVLLVGFREA